MNQLTTPLLHFVWQGAVIAGALALALQLAKGSRTRYALAAAALLLMALAPLLSYGDAAFGTHALGETLPGLAVHLSAAPAAPGSGGLQWLPYVWLCGVALCSIRVMRAAIATRALEQDARVIANPCPGLFHRTVRIVESARVVVPSQLGIFRPVILLPLGLATQMPMAQLEAILAHELAHIHRHDYLVNLLQVFVETVLFYHPGVWWVSNVMRREREHCADEWALEMVRDRHAYAAALLTLEETRQAHFATAANGGDLKTRIERVLAGGTPRGSVLPAVLAVALALGSTLALRAQPRPMPAPTATVAVTPERTIADLKAEISKLRAELAHSKKAEAEARQFKTDRELAAHDQAMQRDEAQAAQKRNAELQALSQSEQERLLLLNDELAARHQRELIQRDDARDGQKRSAELQAMARQVLSMQDKAAQGERERRVKRADEKWTTRDRKGSATPRGRHYIEHGPPDELEIQNDKSEAWLYRLKNGDRRIDRFDSEGNFVQSDVKGK